MRPNPISLLLLVFAGLCFAACSSFAPPDPSAEETSGRWQLAQEKDSKVVVTLVGGMAPAQVREVLGKPRRTRVPGKAIEPTEEWTYHRYVLGGNKVSSAVSKAGQLIVHQRIIYTETLELTFVADKLIRVKTSRIREDTEAAESITPRF
ncbi:MAG: hypothetical protein IPL39_23380 [Opitutaceae bacterium]|nr:hypothetical protein [Opitutaceae bacterium]